MLGATHRNVTIVALVALVLGIAGFGAWYALVDLGARTDVVLMDNARRATHLAGAERVAWQLRYGAARLTGREKQHLVAIVNGNIRAYEALTLLPVEHDALQEWRQAWAATTTGAAATTGLAHLIKAERVASERALIELSASRTLAERVLSGVVMVVLILGIALALVAVCGSELHSRVRIAAS